jgi:spermidine/putrescine ABC transporter ATP-binding subunit
VGGALETGGRRIATLLQAGPAEAAKPGTFVAIEGLRKAYGPVLAVDVDRLEIQPGQLLSIVGPSGCGKTTTLRCIAGLVKPDAGRILIGGRDVTSLPVHQRNLGMVFQNYGIFPHMTVFDNVAFGLEGRGLSKDEMRSRVQAALELVELGGYGTRYRHQLSGGQQQRVALARAVVYQPDVLLLDEPLSNLDAKLRKTMRYELRQLQQRLGLTTVFVTHDQQEALSMSDVVAVMNQGRVEQLDVPVAIYEAPKTPFVADFIGSTNLLPATVVSWQAGDAELTLDGGGRLRIPSTVEVRAGDAVTVLVKPEEVSLADGDALVHGLVQGASYLGSVFQYHVRIGDRVIEVLEPANRRHMVPTGASVGLTFEPEAVHVIPNG